MDYDYGGSYVSRSLILALEKQREGHSRYQIHGRQRASTPAPRGKQDKRLRVCGWLMVEDARGTVSIREDGSYEVYGRVSAG